MEKHTPGPWTIKIQHGVTGDRGTMYVDDSEGDAEICQMADINREANGRLIAAAPDVRRKILDLADEIESWKEFGFDSVIRRLREIAGENS
ncbi:hypothetical protein LCGC14_2447250 [marine sediment metagenome]|uniref:Uncharacterized protein n=1 Tax=marine sediment metagenome TaxID=412755 RepID=A0A0F9DUC4_9ZZZZ